MPTIYDNNLKITSKWGFKRSGGVVTSVVPAAAETTKHLWEPVERPLPAITFETKILRHQPSPVPAFNSLVHSTATSVYTPSIERFFGLEVVSSSDELRYYTTGTTATITLVNQGNTVLTVNTITQSPIGNLGVIAVRHTPLPIVVPGGGSAPLVMSYYGATEGNFSNYLILFSDFPGGFYKIPTFQNVQNTLEIEINPTGQVTIAEDPGQQVLHSYTVTPIINGIQRPDLIVDLDINLETTDPGFSVINNENNTFIVKFSAMSVGANGIYSANANVVAQAVGLTATTVVSNTVQLSVDYTRFINYGSWISPAAPFNSVIGLSYDSIDNQRYLTIGVGTGGDGTPVYAYGGQIFTATSSLSFLGTASDYPYTGWATVYRMPIGNTPTTYYSSATNALGEFLYKVKSTAGIDYENYFGSEGSRASMFLVDTDGQGNIVVSMNYLRDLSDDESLNMTLKNLTRAFYYYSNVDNPNRYYQLDPGPILDGSVTRLFYGFNNSGTVLTSIVNLPVSN